MGVPEATAAPLGGSEPPSWEPRFGGLRLQTSRPLGRGAFGEVFLVKASPAAVGEGEGEAEGNAAPAAAAVFALKRSSLAQISEVGVERAKGEASLLQRLGEEHESILRCFDYRVVGGSSPTLELLLEFAPLGDLNGWLRCHRDRQEPNTTGGGGGCGAQLEGLPEAEVVSFAFDVAAGLAHIHALRPKVLHRDIKPANVVLFPLAGLVEGVPRAKLADFGIAKILETDSSFARAATVIGTPHYFSPEICRGETYDERSDAWALGCVIYEMVCLQRPFHQAEGNIAVLALRVMEGRYDKETLMQCAGKYNGQVVLLLVNLLHLEPKERARASDVVQPLRSLRDGVGGTSVTLHSVPWWESVSALQLGFAGDESCTLPAGTFMENAGADEVTKGYMTDDSWAGAQQMHIGSRPASPWVAPLSGGGAPATGGAQPPTEPPTLNPLQEALLTATVLPSEKWVRTQDLLSNSAAEDPPTLLPEPPGSLAATAGFGDISATIEAACEAGGFDDSLGGTLRPGDTLPPCLDSPYANSLLETAHFDNATFQTEWLREDVSSAFLKSELAAPSRLAWMGYTQEETHSAPAAEVPGELPAAVEAMPAGATPVGAFGSPSSLSGTAFSFGASLAAAASEGQRTAGPMQTSAEDVPRCSVGSAGGAGPRIFLRPLRPAGFDGGRAAADDGPVIFCFTPETRNDQDSGPPGPPPPRAAQPLSRQTSPLVGGGSTARGAGRQSNAASGWLEVELTGEALGQQEGSAEAPRSSSTCGIFSLTALD